MTTLNWRPCLLPSHRAPTQIACLTNGIGQQQTTLLLMLVSQATLIRRAHAHDARLSAHTRHSTLHSSSAASSTTTSAFLRQITICGSTPNPEQIGPHD